MRNNILIILMNAATAFIDARSQHQKPWTSTWRTRLTSNPNAWEDESGSDHSKGGSGEQNKLSSGKRKQLVPLLGPIPGAAPLIVGGCLILDCPTPLQWQTLEESVLLHQQYLKEQALSTDTERSRRDDDMGSFKTAGVDAAPLVAVIDDITGSKSTRTRYATLAAVVGVSSSSSSKRPAGLDMADESSFMESLLYAGTETSPLNKRIRLVGVGRAILKDFFYYKLPMRQSAEEERADEGSSDRTIQNDKVLFDKQDLGHNEDEEERQIPIVMAEFAVIKDTPMSSTATTNRLGTKGARSVHSSPVHALAEMSKIVNRLIHLHDDRRRLVRGLKAAKARLEQANVFEDHDGIGEVTAKDKDDQAIIEEMLARYNHHDIPQFVTSALASMENYGLNYYSAFSAIPQLTTAALETLEPYYSPEVHRSEEHEMEVTSFVAFRALDGFCSPRDLAFALQCTNTVERFEAAYDLMMRHKDLLEDMADYASQDLRDCGEECTDLW